jgi:hypothetical protein
MAVSILIDDAGQTWAANDPALMRRLGYADARVDFVSFAVAERGLIHVRSIEDGVRVTLRPGAFSRVALAGALQALNDLAPPRILLVVRAGRGSQAELFTSVFAFIERAEQLAADPPIEIKVPRYSVQRGLRNLTTPPFAMVRPIVDLWKDRRGELGEEVFRSVESQGLAPRMILVRQPAGTSRLITEHFGPGIMIMRPCEALMIVGRDFYEHHADRQYGAWVADAYAETLWRRHPRLESVRATVRTGAAASLKVRYDRLIMPWRSGERDVFAMALSIQREVPVPSS